MAHFPCNSAELIYAFHHDASSPSLLWILEGQIQAEPVIKMIYVTSPWAEQDAASDIYFCHQHTCNPGSAAANNSSFIWEKMNCFWLKYRFGTSWKFSPSGATSCNTVVPVCWELKLR